MQGIPCDGLNKPFFHIKTLCLLIHLHQRWSWHTGWVMLKSWFHFVHMNASPKAYRNGQRTIRRLFEVVFKATMDCPHTYSQTHTCKTLWGHCFLIHLCTCLYLLPILRSFHVWVSPSHRKKKREEKQRGWIWAEKHPLGLFPFLKELLQISCFIYEGGLRRDTSWHDRQSPSLGNVDRTGPGAPGCLRLVNSWEQNQPFHWNQSVVN